ncbi:MAG TPA: tRNA (adenosine(37)-N6)-dimethylallyltransferase MiaA [Chitinophagaceae bacterium]|nr:tRNA (adenosine(37)-N6)-dimethylallyltransferase MiaA [Chitinophagaceae bacterium]
MEAPKKTVIIIVGPTAVGKTHVAIEVARCFKTEILSADSRQCYRELKIGVARASEEELRRIPHHFIATHSIKEEVSAAGFEQYALRQVQTLFQHHDQLVMTGGTGLYIKAFCEGLDQIPPIDPLIRNEIIKGYEENGLSWLQEQVQQKDPAFYSVGEIQNPQRLMRALEVVEGTGISILTFRKGEPRKRDFEILLIGLQLPKEELHRNIDARVDKMMLEGLEEEARSLLPWRNLKALQTVGYAELFDYFDGKTSLEKAVAQIKTNTRQYAKRQMTWFRKAKQITWFNPRDLNAILHFVQAHTKLDFY